MKYVRTLIAAALLFVASPALAQWQVQNHGIPIGKGGGNNGFSVVAPNATTGLPLLNNAGADPAYGVLPLIGGGTGANTKVAAAFNLFPTPTRAGDIIWYNGTQWVSLSGNNAGTQCLSESSVGVPSWGACGGGSASIVLGTTVVTGGSAGRVLFDNGTVGEYPISGTGNVAMTTSPVFTTPNLGTPSALVLTSATGLPVNTGLSGTGTGVISALTGNVGSAGAFVVNGGAGGTPSSITLTNATGMPASGLTGTVAVANGGTGGSTASGTLLDNITAFSSTGYIRRTGAGAYAFSAAASSAQYLAGTATGVPIEPSVIYQAPVTVTFGATTTFDFSTFNDAGVTLTGNITTMTFANVTQGKSGNIAFIQDATGSRTTVWNSSLRWASGVAPTLTTTANAVDILVYSCRNSVYCIASLMKDVK